MLLRVGMGAALPHLQLQRALLLLLLLLDRTLLM